MGFEIIDGRNHGYPCIPELAERDKAGLTVPVCQFMFVLGRSGYPVIAPIQESSAVISEPLPEYMMNCFREEVNGGYPWIGDLKAIVNGTVSFLYFGDRHVKSMYYEGKAVKTAYCGGSKVYDTYLSRAKIV